MAPILLINAAVTTVIGEVEKNHRLRDGLAAFQVTTTGSPTQVNIEIDGSVNDIDFYPIVIHDVTALGGLFHVKGKSVSSIRARVTALVGGTSPTVTIVLLP